VWKTGKKVVKAIAEPIETSTLHFSALTFDASPLASSE
jgi:hypothetical protein